MSPTSAPPPGDPLAPPLPLVYATFILQGQELRALQHHPATSDPAVDLAMLQPILSQSALVVTNPSWSGEDVRALRSFLPATTKVYAALSSYDVPLFGVGNAWFDQFIARVRPWSTGDMSGAKCRLGLEAVWNWVKAGEELVDPEYDGIMWDELFRTLPANLATWWTAHGVPAAQAIWRWAMCRAAFLTILSRPTLINNGSIVPDPAPRYIHVSIEDQHGTDVEIIDALVPRCDALSVCWPEDVTPTAYQYARVGIAGRILKGVRIPRTP